MTEPLGPAGFWSYARDDDGNLNGRLADLCDLLERRLKLEMGRQAKVFRDNSTIQPGTPFLKEINETLDQCSFLVAVLTPTFLQSDNCCAEVMRFRAREQRLAREDLIFPIHYIDTTHVIPEHFDDCRDPEVLKLLRARQQIKFWDLRLHETKVEEVRIGVLAKAITRALRHGADTRPLPLDSLVKANNVRGTRLLWAAAAVGLAALSAAGVVELLKPPPVDTPKPVAGVLTQGEQPAPGPTIPPAEFSVVTADELVILDNQPVEGTPSIFSFAANPDILIVDFASLRDQGRMLNRVAAFVEKTGLPRDRVLTDAELDVAIRQAGDTVETFNYGHDYSAGSLARFFAAADRDKIRLRNDEETLRRLLRQVGWFEPNPRGALISIPRPGANENITRTTRAAILRHELSQGEYFTNPVYAGFVHRFWIQTLIPLERDRIRRHLQNLGWDSALDDVIINEAQAYLMFTESPESFTPEMIGMTSERLIELRRAFFRDMPKIWLRDRLGRLSDRNK